MAHGHRHQQDRTTAIDQAAHEGRCDAGAEREPTRGEPGCAE
jgi:hypothetical protein